MKIVIDMPEDIWADMKNGHTRLGEIADIVAKGTVLPNGDKTEAYWEKINYGDYESPDIVFRCSNCSEDVEEKSYYCPFCGSQMEGWDE